MDKAVKEYITGLKPEDLPDWREVLNEGIELGRSHPTKQSRFIENSKYNTYQEYKQECADNGKIVWQILMGLATVEEEVNGIKKIYEYSKRTGLEINTVQTIPSQLMCIPKEIRGDALDQTSYVMNKPEDWEAHGKAAPMQVIFEDNALACPNSLETTLNPLLVGSARIGIFSQFIWDFPGCNDTLWRCCEVLKSLGAVSTKKDEYICVDTYLEDGLPGYFMDCTSFIAYAMLDHYIITELCGARMSVSYGGLVSEGDTRMAIGMAVDKMLSTDEWPALSYINGSTVMQWEHDIQANWGPTVQEMLLEILVIKKYKLGMAINPVSITEAITVPTLQDLLDVFAAGARTEEKADEWMDLVDFSKLEEIRDNMCEQAEIMFNNILNNFEECGIDIHNPLELMMVIKKFNPMKFELAFHPTTQDGGILQAFYPTVIGRQTIATSEAIISELTEKGYKGKLDGIKIVTGAGDGHTYGLQLVESVLSEMGAAVVNGGVDMEPSEMLDLADEEGAENVCISVHNGQSLDYAKQISDLASKRKRKYRILMGGKLNAILPGESVATDVSEKIREAGVFPADDLEEQINILMN